MRTRQSAVAGAENFVARLKPRHVRADRSTVPATSIPRTRALGARNPKPMTRIRYGWPVIICQSPICTPAACTRTSTSSTPIAGLSMSCSVENAGCAVVVLDDRLHGLRVSVACVGCGRPSGSCGVHPRGLDQASDLIVVA